MSAIYVHKYIFPAFDIAQTVAGAVIYEGPATIEIDRSVFKGDGVYTLYKGMTQAPYASGLNYVSFILPSGVINDTIYYDTIDNAIKVQLSGD